MSVSAARKIAFDVLLRVEQGGAFASDLLHARLAENVKREDAGLATELTLGVLRWQRLLDFLLERYTKKLVSGFDLEVLLALRLGIYQLRFLERVPARAAVNESVELVKGARKSSAAPLVNAVLRRAAADPSIVAKGNCESLLPAELSLADRFGILHSHPTWMVERWLKAFGETRTVALLKANNRTPRIACAAHPAERREEIVRELESEKLIVESGRLLRQAIVVHGGSPARTEIFRKGRISIQDEASQAVPLLLGVEAGQRVLDLCAAPGGKTAALASAAGPEGSVLAADLHPHRLREMEARLERMGIQNVKTVALDAASALPFKEKFERILVDAPCSGTGTLARNPEIRWRLAEEDLSELHKTQVALLSNAITHLADGGRLVYSTCSLEPEENEQVIAEALRGTGVRIAPAAESAARIGGYLAEGVAARGLFDSSGAFRTFPPEQNTDGFYACVLEKRGG
jgi:16S rRNA (cytosine967-C5)-methyltransferase